MRTWVLPPAAVPVSAQRSRQSGCRSRGAQLFLRCGSLALLLAGLLQATSGCTLAGAIVGAAYPRYETVPAKQVRELPPGTEVEVDAAEVTWTRDNVPRTTSPTAPIRGELVDNRGRYIVVGTGPDTAGFVDRRYALEVKVHKGSYAGTGALVGLFIDLAVLATLAASARGAWNGYYGSGSSLAQGAGGGH